MPLVLKNIEKQDYPNLEVIINNDTNKSIGAKFNESIESCRGDLIARIDDDVWYAMDRISSQVRAIGKKPFVGSSHYYIYDLFTEASFLIGGHAFVGYESYMFTREAWKKCHFSDSSMGESTGFSFVHYEDTIDQKEPKRIVSFRHKQNVTSEYPCNRYPCDKQIIETLVGPELNEWKECVRG
jgi:hypothetical protein